MVDKKCRRHFYIRTKRSVEDQELEKKFSQTGAFQNMKKMLGQKNSQLKQLRIKLEKYEPLENDKIECEED
ncbi:Leucine zipper transcription factor-like protein 1 [Armadillidium nasatum]|uniref:Leucine zipper transcription factor-like protein 1 n=1 Tax=Armadillidium nasatum TaxID=96803 RepID=A0A5N5SU87_9CRUS|nr:Leucine zipper transcription factor-like protein 1 [Armadillidium nasatum]